MAPTEAKESFDLEAFRATFMDLKRQIHPSEFSSADMGPWESTEPAQLQKIRNMGTLVATAWREVNVDDRFALMPAIREWAHAGLFEGTGNLALEKIIAATEDILHEGPAPTMESGEVDTTALKAQLLQLLQSMQSTMHKERPSTKDQSMFRRFGGAAIEGYMANALSKTGGNPAIAQAFNEALFESDELDGSRYERHITRAYIASAVFRGVANILAKKMLRIQQKQQGQEGLLQRLPMEFTDADLRRVIRGDQNEDPVGFTCLESVVAIALEMDSEGTLRKRYDRLMEENENEGPPTMGKIFKIFSILTPTQQEHIREALAFLYDTATDELAGLLDNAERPRDFEAFVRGSHVQQERVMELMQAVVNGDKHTKRLTDLLAMYLWEVYQKPLRDPHMTADERETKKAGYRETMKELRQNFATLFNFRYLERALRDIIFTQPQGSTT